MPDENVSVFEEDVDRKIDVVSYEESRDNNRVSGISFIGNVSWGTHLCQFYKTKEDLLDILVPYFKAGLENNEFCMWVTSKPLNVEEAKTALGKVVKDLDDYIKKGQMEILDYRSWYVKSGKFDSDRVLKGWVEKEKKALKKGFDGLRLTGNTFWLEKKNWDDFKSYEETVNDVIDKHRMIAICSYSLKKCNESEIIDVISNHQFTIIRRGGKWNIIESSKQTKTKEELEESKEKYRSLIENSGAGIVTIDIKGRLSYVNEAICKITGYSKSELIGKPYIDFIHPDEKKKTMKLFLSASLEPKRKHDLEFRFIHKNGNIITCYTNPTIFRLEGKIRGFNAIIQDITKRKQVEQIANEAREYTESIVDTIREPLIVLDADLRVVSANRAFYQTFKTKPEETEGQLIYDIGNQQWDIPKLRALLEKILPKNTSFDNYEVEHVFPHIGKRVMLLNARRIPQPPAKPRIILLAVEDITERKKTEEEIKNLAKFSSENPNPVLRIKKDGEVVYSNKAGFEVLDFWKTNIGKDAPKRWRNIIRKKFASKNLKAEEEEEEEVNDKIFSFMIVPVVDEGYINLYGRDITKRKIAEQALKESEEKYRLIAENTNDLITITNLDKTFRYVSPSIKSIGYNPDELIGQDSFQFLHPDDKISITAMLKQLISGLFKPGVDSRFEYRLRDKSGAYHNYETTSKLIKNESGKHMILSISRDITKRKKAEENLQESKVEIESIFDSSPNAITVTDMSGSIVQCNQETLNMHGFSNKDEVLGKNSFIFIAEKDHQRATENMMKVLEQGVIKNVEYTLSKKDMSEFIGELSASVMKNTHGKPVGFVAITKDITERKKSEEEIKKQNAQLKKLNRIKTDFLNVTSHELRTPMASIKGYVQMILRRKLGDITEEERNALEVVLRNINRLDHLIQDMLDISLLESKSMKFIPEKTNIKDVISEIIESMYCKALEKNIKIITKIDKNLPEVILDKERIRQVIINIIDNSIKFSHNGTIINIRGKKQQKKLLFEIQDQGRGIPKNHQKKIFSSFYQVDSGEDRKYGGAGLGLAISKNIIDIHGGKFWVESTGEPGKGSIFKFVLPVNSEDFLKKIKETDISDIYRLERNK